VLLLLLAACDGRFDGTWLFMVDPEPALSGDCAAGGTDTGATVETTGTERMWVDIYATGQGGLVVLFDRPLVGDAEGTSMSASWKQERDVGGVVESDEIAIDGTLSAGELAGELVETAVDSAGTCTETYGYTALRATTPPDQMAGH
jgi:hypothetical protein